MIGTLRQLAARPGMPSEPLLRRLAVLPGFPLVERGRKGKRYAIDLDAAEAFVRQYWSDGRHGPRGLRL